MRGRLNWARPNSPRPVELIDMVVVAVIVIELVVEVDMSVSFNSTKLH